MKALTLVLVSAMLISGCAMLPTKVIVLGGIKDIIDVPVGAEVCGVELPTNEVNKTYCIVTSKPMRLISQDAWNNLEKQQ